MLSESKFTQKLLKALRQQMPGAVILKHSDRLTSGIPDFSISQEGRTSWVEVKLTTASRGRMFEPLQLEMLRRLRGFYVIHAPSAKISYLFQASEIGNGMELWDHEPLTFNELVDRMKRTL